MGIRVRTWAAALAVSLATLPLAADTAMAQGPAAVRQRVESSMLLTGTIDLRADGTVAGHVIDQDDKLTPALRNLVAQAAATWRFEPVTLDPGSTIGRARMSLRVVARKDEGDGYAVRIGSASFGRHSERTPPVGKSPDGVDGRRINRDMRPPRYPQPALQADVGGTVYLVLKIDREGRVSDAVAEQTNLRFVASEAAMARWRLLFERASIAAGRDWKFQPPDADELIDAAFASVRVPISYIPPKHAGRPVDAAGTWDVYVPGPRVLAPWLRSDLAGNDALVAGEVHAVGTGLKLLTPLQPQG